MPDSPVSPIEQVIARLIQRERVANSLAGEARAREQALYREIEALFRKIDPTGPTRTRYQTERREKFVAELSTKLREHAPEMEAWMKDRLAVIGRSEAVAAQVDLVASLGSVAKDRVSRTPITQQRLRAILNTDPFRGRILKEHAQRHSANVLDRVRSEVRLGMVNEESTADIVRRIRGRQTGFIRQHPKTGAFVPKGTRGAVVRRRFTGGVLETTTRQAEALVRTAVTHVSNVGQLETFRENASVVTGTRFVAALDDRTTPECLAWDSTVWSLDSSDIQMPPLHYNCRSILVPEIDYEGLGLTEPPEGDRMVRDLSTVDDEDLARKVSARRRTGDFGDVKRVPSSQTADAWFRQQRAAVQNKLVGRGRAEAFRAGEITTLKDLIAGDNSLIPLDDLLRN